MSDIMRKLLFAITLISVSLNASAAGCLGLTPAARQACLDKITVNIPEPSSEQKTLQKKQGDENSERYKKLADEMRAKEAAEARAIFAERERVAKLQAEQQAVAAQNRRDAVAEETLWELQRRPTQVQQTPQPAPAPAPRPMNCYTYGGGYMHCN